MKSDLLVQSRIELRPRIRKPSRHAHVLHPIATKSAWINGPSLLYQNNTKVSENKIYNLLHEFNNIDSSCLNSMKKHQDYQSFIKRNQ